MQNSVRLVKQVNHQDKIIQKVGLLSDLMSFKLADMVNIALEEGTYYKTQEWCSQNADKYLAENN